MPSGEKTTVILNEQEYLSKNHNVTVEYIEMKNSVLGKLTSLIWSFSNYFKIIKLVEKHNPDIIHFHTIVPYISLSVLYAAKKESKKQYRHCIMEDGYVLKVDFLEKVDIVIFVLAPKDLVV